MGGPVKINVMAFKNDLFVKHKSYKDILQSLDCLDQVSTDEVRLNVTLQSPQDVDQLINMLANIRNKLL